MGRSVVRKTDPRGIEGKTIARLEMRPFEDDGRTLYDPVIVFTDGSRLTFGALQASDGYGIELNYWPAR